MVSKHLLPRRLTALAALGMASLVSILSGNAQADTPASRVKTAEKAEVELNLQNRFNSGIFHDTDTRYRIDNNILDVELMIKSDAFLGYIGGQTTDPLRVPSSQLSTGTIFGVGYRIRDDKLRFDVGVMLTNDHGTEPGYRLRLSGNELKYGYAAAFQENPDALGGTLEGKVHVKGPVFVEGLVNVFNDSFKVGAGVGYGFFTDYGTIRASLSPFYRWGEGTTVGTMLGVSFTIPGSYEKSPRIEYQKTQKPGQQKTGEQRTQRTEQTRNEQPNPQQAQPHDDLRNQQASAVSSDSSPLVQVGTYVKCINNDCLLAPTTEAYLRKATQLAQHEGYGLIVTSTYRTQEQQKELHLAYGSLACGPPYEHCPHVRGIAVDVTLENLSGQRLDTMGCMGAQCTDDVRYNAFNPSHRTLRTIMENAGFHGIKKEWWHYEVAKDIKNNLTS